MMFHEQLPRNSLMMFDDAPSNLHYLHFVARRFSSHVAEYQICFFLQRLVDTSKQVLLVYGYIPNLLL